MFELLLCFNLTFLLFYYQPSYNLFNKLLYLSFIKIRFNFLPNRPSYTYRDVDKDVAFLSKKKNIKKKIKLVNDYFDLKMMNRVMYLN